MKPGSLWLAVAPFALAAPAAAQTAETSAERLELVGLAPPACVFKAPTAARTTNASFSVAGASSATLRITQLVDPNTASPLASDAELNLPVVCNASHRVVVRSSNKGLLRAGAQSNNRGSGTFGEFLPYRIALDWSGQTLEQSSEVGTATFANAQPASGALALRVATPAGGAPLLSGQYNDSIVVEFQVAN